MNERSLWVAVALAFGTALVVAPLVGAPPAARAGGLGTCGPDDLAVKNTDARRDLNDVVAVTALGTWGTSSCVLRVRLSVALKAYKKRLSPTGTIQGIKGNPAARALDVVLRPGGLLVYSWRWRNWCGRQGRFVVQPAWGRYAFWPSQRVRPPTCKSKVERSTFVQVKHGTRSCTRADYRVTTDLGQPFMTRLIDLVEFTLRPTRSPCLLRHVRVKFTVQGRSGGTWAALSGIQGNPAWRTLGAMLTREEGLDVFWAWGNWCGGGDRFRALAEVGERSVAGPTWTQGATCEDPGAPSTLTPSYGHL